jgi:hypothetical protein
VVRLETIDELLAEVDRITEATTAGTMRSLGNWSPAQIIWHIGRLVELSFDGFPFRYRRAPPWVTRLFRRFAWRWLIALAFRPGFKNPPAAAVLEPDPSVTLTGASDYLKRQLARIRNGERMLQECSVEGPYSHQQWVYIHLRHAELHLGFLTEEAKEGLNNVESGYELSRRLVLVTGGLKLTNRLPEVFQPRQREHSIPGPSQQETLGACGVAAS